MRVTNPPTNPELLDALAKDCVDHDFDIKHIIRTIMTSNAYGLSSVPNATNTRDTWNHSRFIRRPIPAEVLLDAVSDVTGVPESFEGMMPGTRAVQVWDNQLASRFLDVFGRPDRESVCECERQAGRSLSQSLHLMNSPNINAKLRHPTGTAATLAASAKSVDELADHVYLSALSRHPTDRERTACLKVFDHYGDDRQSAIEDILWVLINSADFVLNH